MKRLLMFACCFWAINASPTQEIKRVGHPRIILGDDVEIEDAPYQVSIMRIVNGTEKLTCGGTIVSKNAVLTAGHCVYLKPEQYVIRSGSSNWNKGGQTHEVNDIIRHENYEEDQWGRLSHDVAIMKVNPEFKLDGEKEKLSTLPEKDEKVQPGDKAFLTGWGYIHEKSKKIPDQLQGLVLNIMDLEECGKDYEHFGNMTEYSICAKVPSGDRDMCNGDSGGPLVVNGKQVGIVSWSGPGCAIPGLPGVYADVAKYRDWIDQHIEA